VPASIAAPTPDRRRVLVVDDDPMLRQMLADILGQQGHDVIEAASGEAAVEAFRAHAPHLVLLDVMMPGIDGFETCTRLRALDPDEDVPILMVTGADDVAAIDRAFSVRATDFITKPFRWALLLQRVRYAMRTGELRREVRSGRQRDAAALRVARMVFWEWTREGGGRFQWSDASLPLDGASVPAPSDPLALLALVHPADRGRARRAWLRTHEGHEAIDLELRLVVGEGERVVRLVGEPGGGAREGVVVAGALQDITTLRQTEAFARHLALHDELTGLGNRRCFLGGLRDLLASCAGTGDVVLVGCLDLARFQRLNDALGEQAGDQLLRRLARRMQAFLPAPALVARIGGDDFAVAIRAPGPELARLRFDGLMAALQERYVLPAGDTVLQLIAGVAVSPRDAGEAEALLVLAEEAQRTARASGAPVGTVRRAVGDGRSALEALSLERALRTAVEEERLSLAVQPQMDMHSGTIVGVECLLRWRLDDGTEIPPVEFVPLLEESGLIMEAGAWVLEEACRLQRLWAAAGHDLRVGLNVSPRQFVDPALLDRFAGIIAGHDLTHGRIELELTESLAMQEPQHTVRVLGALREMGVVVAVDDFGVGHSSLAYLLRFPIDTLKIDRTFVHGITTSRPNQAIVRAATAMAQSLGLSTIAEGVETLREADFVDALGVREIQGWLVGRAMSPERFPDFLRDFRRPGLADA
jgi:diguanylate cyclase (GGDEF)-like protein